MCTPNRPITCLEFSKPTSKSAVTSNLVIALRSGQEISMRLLSDGSEGTAPVDFIVNYQPRQSFLNVILPVYGGIEIARAILGVGGFF
jgi:hypothetical protein